MTPDHTTTEKDEQGCANDVCKEKFEAGQQAERESWRIDLDSVQKLATAAEQSPIISILESVIREQFNNGVHMVDNDGNPFVTAVFTSTLISKIKNDK